MKQGQTPWEELGIPENNWIEICFIMGVYKHPRLQVRMAYPRHTEVEWSTIETFRTPDKEKLAKTWGAAITWGCPVRLLGFRSEVVREFKNDGTDCTPEPEHREQ